MNSMDLVVLHRPLGTHHDGPDAHRPSYLLEAPCLEHLLIHMQDQPVLSITLPRLAFDIVPLCSLPHDICEYLIPPFRVGAIGCWI